MFKLLAKKRLAPNIYSLIVEAPQIATLAKPGQFIILTIDEKGQKIPLTIYDYNSIKGTVSIVLQAVGQLSNKIIDLKEGNTILGFVGPLGTSCEFIYEDIRNLKKKTILFVVEEIASATVYPQIKWLCENKIDVNVIICGRSKDFIILDEDIKALGAKVYICTEDGSYGLKGLVTDKIKLLVEDGNKYDEIFAIGGIVMMMDFAPMISDYVNVEKIESLNDLIIDGSDVFGGCKVTVKVES